MSEFPTLLEAQLMLSEFFTEYGEPLKEKDEPIPSTPVRLTLDEGPGSNFLGTNLNSCQANWILKLECTWVPSLILGSPNQELSF
jgi:hypothetical protein